MSDSTVKSLRILIANERKDRLERIAEIVTGLGHEVISSELEVSEVAAATDREHPDLAFVGMLLDRPGFLQEERETLGSCVGPTLSVSML